jgi:hypothetical protein
VARLPRDEHVKTRATGQDRWLAAFTVFNGGQVPWAFQEAGTEVQLEKQHGLLRVGELIICLEYNLAVGCDSAWHLV